MPTGPGKLTVIPRRGITNTPRSRIQAEAPWLAASLYIAEEYMPLRLDPTESNGVLQALLVTPDYDNLACGQPSGHQSGQSTANNNRWPPVERIRLSRRRTRGRHHLRSRRARRQRLLASMVANPQVWACR